MNKRTVIVSGGMLEEAFALDILKSEKTEFIIAADKGLCFLYRHHIMPDYIVGDFDSTPKEVVDFYKNEANVPIRQFNPVKDASDTEIALRHALNLGRKNILLIGATGTRLDHVWANVQSLKIAQDAGAEVMLMDSHNRIRVLNQGIVLKKDEAFGTHFSVFPLDGMVSDFNIRERNIRYLITH